MSIITILLITILIPSVQLTRPSIQLTFTPDDKYMSLDHHVDIKCELLNPTESTDTPQLWYVDLKTGKRTSISRSLLLTPPDDAPDVFKQNKNKRYEFVRKNYIRIQRLLMEDSAKYECNCPDCLEPIAKETRDFYVMKIVEPRWVIDSAWPLHENTKIPIKCIVDNFYPHVSHKILRNHHEITNDGKSSLSNINTFPQTFSWEATITPTAEWHDTILRCSVTEGNTIRSTNKTLDVLFVPQFLNCDERQYVDSKKEQSTIECSYSGNPQPKLTWLRKTDQKPITSDMGITIETKQEPHGKYKSIVTFDRNKLMSIPLPITTNGQRDTSEEDYYQHLLNGSFIAKLTVNGNDKGTREINIVRDVNQARSSILNNSITISLSSMLFTFLLIIHIIRC